MISLNPDKAQLIDQMRAIYDQELDFHGDWGEFVTTAALLGLVTLGVYSLVRATDSDGSPAIVLCPACRVGCMVVRPVGSRDRLGAVVCPNCHKGMVADFGPARKVEVSPTAPSQRGPW